MTDIIFLRDYIKFLQKNCTINQEALSKNKYLEITVPEKNIEIKILMGGGYTAIVNLSKNITSHIDVGYKVFVIQDADNQNKENGGVNNRIEYLNKFKTEKGIDFSIFLFPNNKDDGDLETLLLRIKNESKYNITHDCYIKYIECISKFSNQNFIHELKEDKNKVFNYISTYYGMDNAKEQNRCYEIDYWDLNHNELKPLKMFLNLV